MPQPPDAAMLHQQRQQAIAAQITGQVRRSWATLAPGSLEAGWAAVRDRVFAIVASGQLLAASLADTYLDEVLAEQDIDIDRAGTVRPRAFAGIASDGRQLDSLLLQPVIGTRVDLAHGVPPANAMRSGEARMVRIVGTQIADASRTATTTAMTARPAATRYVRVLTVPSCTRCSVLAGRVYRWSTGFRRHPRCFPADVVVSGPCSLAATRRWYEGELVVLTTASGQKLPLTGNHPVLTGRGWVPAHLLHEGDDVVRSTRPEGAAALVVPDHDEVPSLIEDQWRALGVAGLQRVPSAPEDFHGDGQHGEVDVVRADRSLWRDRVAVPADHVGQQFLAVRVVTPPRFEVERSAQLFDLRSPALTGGAIRRGGLGLPLFAAHLLGTHDPGGAAIARCHACGEETFPDGAAREAVLVAEREFAGAAEVGGDDSLDRQLDALPRWDAPGVKFAVETRAGYARLGHDLRDRLASQVELDRLVDVRRVQWSGHVFSLSTAEGWHSANNLIVSNCDCSMAPTSAALAGDIVNTADPVEVPLTGVETAGSRMERLIASAGTKTAAVEALRAAGYLT